MNHIPKNILITGGAGFIGSHFIIYLLEKYKNIQIFNLDKLTYAANLNHLDSIKNYPHYHFIKGDIGDKKLVIELLLQHSIDTIINFAAESHVDRSIIDPETCIYTNVVGTQNMLACAVQVWQKLFNLNPDHCRFHQISTDEVYGSLKLNEPAFTENSRYQPSSPYSASKAAADHWVRAYFNSYMLPATVSICSNNYGQHQHSEKLIPKIIQCCLEMENIPIYGNGENIRDWLYVDDHCEAIDIILHHGQIGLTYNVGGGEEISNIAMAQLICQIMDSLLPEYAPHNHLIQFIQDRPGHDFRYAINSDFLRNAMAWSPKHKISDILPQLIITKLKQRSLQLDVV